MKGPQAFWHTSHAGPRSTSAQGHLPPPVTGRGGCRHAGARAEGSEGQAEKGRGSSAKEEEAAFMLREQAGHALGSQGASAFTPLLGRPGHVPREFLRAFVKITNSQMLFEIIPFQRKSEIHYYIPKQQCLQ